MELVSSNAKNMVMNRASVATSCFALLVMYFFLLVLVHRGNDADIQHSIGMYTALCTNTLVEGNRQTLGASNLKDPLTSHSTGHMIPDILWFTYKIDLWNRSNYNSWYPVQQRLADNVQRTARMHASMRVEFLGDNACEKAISNLRKFSPKEVDILLQGFRKEGSGMMKGDLCRGAVLYNEGGYYFDVDLYPVVDIRSALPASTEFTSCYEPDTTDRFVYPFREIFQAFIGSTPGHAIIRKYVEKFVSHYSNKNANGAIGVFAMGNAVKEVSDADIRKNVYLLQEGNLNNMAKLLRRPPSKANVAVGCLGRETKRLGDSGDVCNYVVYDPTTAMLLLYSRVPGASKLCYNKHEHFLKDTGDNISLKTIQNNEGIQVRFVA